MMIYMGSKSTYSQRIIEAIQNDTPDIEAWVEPFVGIGSVISKVGGVGERIGFDVNQYLIALLQQIQEDPLRIPEYMSREQCYNIRQSPEKFPKWLVGWVCIGCTFRGKWRGSWVPWQYQAEQRNRAQRMDLSGVLLGACSYKNLVLKPNDVVFCDPPYGKEGYRGFKFNTAEFWHWVCQLQNTVYVVVDRVPFWVDYSEILTINRAGAWTTGADGLLKIHGYKGSYYAENRSCQELS